jgi:hypothetical protein
MPLHNTDDEEFELDSLASPARNTGRRPARIVAARQHRQRFVKLKGEVDEDISEAEMSFPAAGRSSASANPDETAPMHPHSFAQATLVLNFE